MSAAPSRVRYLVLAALCLSAVISNVQRNCLGVAETTLRAEFGLTKDQTADIMSAFFLTYALAQVPAGWLGGLWGTRFGLAVFIALSSLSMVFLGLANGFAVMLAARLAMGAAQAGTLPCCVNTIAHWLPQTRRGLASGAIGACLSVGGALGADLTGRLLGVVSLQTTFLLYAVPGLLWSAWFWFWFRDRPGEHRAVNRAEAELIERDRTEATAGPREPIPWRAILTSASLWWVCGQQFFKAAGYIFFASWFATYLQEARGVRLQTAGWMTSLPLWAIVAGSPVGGQLSDWLLARTGSRRIGRQAPAVVTQAGCAGLILAGHFQADTLVAVALITIGALCSALGGPPGYAVTIDLGGRHVPVVFGVMNMAGNIGAWGFTELVPKLLGDPGQPSWDRVMIAFAAMYLAASLCWLCLNPNRAIAPPGDGKAGEGPGTGRAVR